VTLTAPTIADIKIIDVDTHLTEPYDLWTSRAPSGYRDRILHVEQVDGLPTWIVDGFELGKAGGGSVVRRDGSKWQRLEFKESQLEDIHEGAHMIKPRLQLMDELGIWAQLIYPNVVGFGAQAIGKVQDEKLRLLCVTIWNDAMAAIQEESSDRLYPMGILPWWDIDATVKEATRIKGLGLKGVTTNSDPQDQGLPDLVDRHWEPMWEVLEELSLPLNFHIGCSEKAMTWTGTSPWPGQSDGAKVAIASIAQYLGNARVLSNIIYSGVLERHPNLKVVSVESGLGWIPFLLKALDYHIKDADPDGASSELSMAPSEYFRRQIYTCFWFESQSPDLVQFIESIGVDKCMFETDFPHPTCLYPDPVETVAIALAGVDDGFRRKVLCGNAAHVYGIDVPEG
jgi:predicted TIM-barrel fold metal-dependent hydrolase